MTTRANAVAERQRLNVQTRHSSTHPPALTLGFKLWTTVKTTPPKATPPNATPPTATLPKARKPPKQAVNAEAEMEDVEVTITTTVVVKRSAGRPTNDESYAMKAKHHRSVQTTPVNATRRSPRQDAKKVSKHETLNPLPFLPFTLNLKP